MGQMWLWRRMKQHSEEELLSIKTEDGENSFDKGCGSDALMRSVVSFENLALEGLSSQSSLGTVVFDSVSLQDENNFLF